MITLQQEQPSDWWEVEALYDLTFAPGREALSSYRFRNDVAPIAPMCLVERDEAGILGGAVRSWPVRVAGQDVILFGPVAVHPTRQGEGLGAYLIYKSIEIGRELGWSRMMLVGDAPYYQRFGFSKLTDVIMPQPTNPERVMGIELVAGAWQGVVGPVQKATA